jgi:hypothetical protein
MIKLQHGVKNQILIHDGAEIFLSTGSSLEMGSTQLVTQQVFGASSSLPSNANSYKKTLCIFLYTILGVVLK